MAEWQRHALANRLQTLLLVGLLLAIAAAAGWLWLGESGLWLALSASTLALLIEPAAASRLTLALYRAQPLAPNEAPALTRIMAELAQRAGLPQVPRLYRVASPLANAFAVGSRAQAHIVLTDGLLHGLSLRELAGVLAHETAHIVHGDLRVMGLADYLSRLTSLFALSAQLMLLVFLPAWAMGRLELPWPGLLWLLFSPQIALLAQLGLSRVREFDADLTAVRLTGDPAGLASALARIERASRSWRAWLMPGWGNPEPSWLRTHPATGERIARLQALQETQASWAAEPWSWPHPPAGAPRWRLGGIWR
ncbi:heat shock protein HtpX [Sulfuritortus calidifontis]|uniref:Heat shock protein HtpX n=1 Tax=Sulfuritortus calidifontis TaxID=1914471 RepID=A0A4R3JT64_9PROT|nr:heat shock protein HtpX [Sulfuritortus calidifontis]